LKEQTVVAAFLIPRKAVSPRSVKRRPEFANGLFTMASSEESVGEESVLKVFQGISGQKE